MKKCGRRRRRPGYPGYCNIAIACYGPLKTSIHVSVHVYYSHVYTCTRVHVYQYGHTGTAIDLIIFFVATPVPILPTRVRTRVGILYFILFLPPLPSLTTGVAC